MEEVVVPIITNQFLAVTAQEMYQSYVFDEVQPAPAADPGLIRCAEYMRFLYDSSEHNAQSHSVDDVARKLKEIYTETHGDDDGLDLMAHHDHPEVWQLIARWMAAALHADSAEEAVQFADDLVRHARQQKEKEQADE